MEEGAASKSGRSGDGRARMRRRFCGEMRARATALAARAVVGTDGEVWTANSAFCSLVGLDEPALRHLGWRQLVHSADHQYVAAHLVEVLAGSADRREFELRLVPPDGRDVPTRIARGVGPRHRRAARAGSSWRPGQLRRIPAAMDVVDTAEDAAHLELAPLGCASRWRHSSTRTGIGEGRLDAERIGEGHSNIIFLVKPRRRPRGAAPPAAPTAASPPPTTCCARRAC